MWYQKMELTEADKQEIYRNLPKTKKSFFYRQPLPTASHCSSFKTVSSFLGTNGGFSFFYRRGGKILGGVQVICNMSFLMLWEGHEMASQSAPDG